MRTTPIHTMIQFSRTSQYLHSTSSLASCRLLTSHPSPIHIPRGFKHWGQWSTPTTPSREPHREPKYATRWGTGSGSRIIECSQPLARSGPVDPQILVISTVAAYMVGSYPVGTSSSGCFRKRKVYTGQKSQESPRFCSKVVCTIESSN